MVIPDDEVREATAREAAIEDEGLVLGERERGPEARLIDGPLTGLAGPAGRGPEAIGLARCEVDRGTVLSVAEGEFAHEVPRTGPRKGRLTQMLLAAAQKGPLLLPVCPAELDVVGQA
jgi:hypothetical protein